MSDNVVALQQRDEHRHWVQTHTGIAVDLLDPQPDTIHPRDIEVALARQMRFNGHTIDTFSVAQHSVLVLQAFDDIAEREKWDTVCLNRVRLAVLLHDAHEAYMGDIVRPVGSLPGFAAPVEQLKRRLQRAIHERFDLPRSVGPGWAKVIHHCDMVALATEKRDLMAPEPRSWGDMAPPLAISLKTFGYRYELARAFSHLLEQLASATGIDPWASGGPASASRGK